MTCSVWKYLFIPLAFSPNNRNAQRPILPTSSLLTCTIVCQTIAKRSRSQHTAAHSMSLNQMIALLTAPLNAPNQYQASQARTFHERTITTVHLLSMGEARLMTYPRPPMETHLDHRDPPMPYQRKGYNRTTRWKSTRRWGHAGELREDAYSNNSYANPTHSTRTRDGTLFRALASLMKCPCWTIAFSSTLLTAATLLTACGHAPAYYVTASALDCSSLTTDVLRSQQTLQARRLP